MSNLPNLSNYEEWLINHLEGLLDAEETAVLLAFLDQHPNIKAEFDLLTSQDLAIEPLAITQDFSYLKKPEIGTLSTANENDLIALLEGDLAPFEAAQLTQQIALQPALKNAYDLFKKTKMSPSAQVFENKEKLKRKKAILLSMLPLRITAIAAALLLLSYGSWLFLNQTHESEITGQMMVNKELPAISNEEVSTGPETVRSKSKSKSKSKSMSKGKRVELATEGFFAAAKMDAQRIALHGLPVFETVEMQRPMLKPIERMPMLKYNNPSLMALNEPKFLKPSEWILQKIKRNIPAQALVTADTISRGGAGYLAMDLLTKTTGISMETYANENDPRRRVALVSKYFSYERVSYQKNN